MGSNVEIVADEWVYCTSTFNSSLRTIKKGVRKNKNACVTDICAELKGKDPVFFEESNTRFRSAGKYSFYKVRVKNSSSQSGKSGGYRVIVGVQNDPYELSLLFVFPKSGSNGLDSIGSDFSDGLIKTFAIEKQSNSLRKHSLNHNLKEIRETDSIDDKVPLLPD